WTLIISIIGYYGLLDMGIMSAIMRYVARYAGQKNYNAVNQTASTAFTIFCLIGGAVALASLMIAGPLARFFNVEAHDINSFKQVILLLGLTAGLMFPSNALIAIILAHERFVIGNIIKIIVIALRGGVSFIVLYCGGGLIELGWVYVSTTAFAIVVHSIVMVLCFKHVKIQLGKFNKTSARALLSFGFFSLIIKIGVLFRTKLGSLVIGKFLDMNSVGIYGVAVLLFAFLMRLAVSCSGVTQPRLAALAGQDSGKTFADAVLRYSVFIANFTVGIGLVAFLLCRDFLRLWLPENFEETNVAAMTFYILLVGLIPEMISGVSSNALEALKRHPYHACQTIIELVASIVLSVSLVGRFGIMGVAIGCAIPTFIAKLIFQPIYCCRVSQLNWFKYVLGVFIKPILVVAFFAAIVAVLEWGSISFHAVSYFQLALKGLGILSLYSILAYLFCFDAEDRRLINTRLKFRNLKEIAVTG
ncbi:MAG: oligosaccharide flippase family protein, partial [Planctomycetota bacterium]